MAPSRIASVTAAATTASGILQQPQDLDELALAAVAHARLQQMAQVLERLGQLPALQRRRLVERIGLGLDQGEIMQRIGDELALAIATGVTGNLGARRTGSRPRRRSPSPPRPGSRRPSAPSSRCSGSGPARSTRPGARFSHGSSGTAGKGRSAARSAVSRSPIVPACRPARSPCRGSTLRQHGVERLEAGRDRDRGHEVGPGELHQPLDLALVVPLAGTAEPILEQVMADQAGERPGPLALAVAADPAPPPA